MPRVLRAIGLALCFAIVPTPLGAQPVQGDRAGAPPNDTVGVGFARTEFSDNFLPAVRQALDLGPALQKMLGSNGTLRNVDTAVAGGARMYIRF
jgi:hypothetical protein